MCAVVDESGGVVTTIHPIYGPWSNVAKIDGKTPLTGVSCPTLTLCVAVDANGNVITSTKPTGGRSAWARPVKIDTATAAGGGPAGLTGISCPTPTLCVAVDGAPTGSVFVSTNPAGGAAAWHAAQVATGPLTSVSCASSTLCVAAGIEHYVSIAPTGGVSAWKATGLQLGGGVFSAIDCPAIALCIATGYGNTNVGLATATTTPTGRPTDWVTSDVESAPPVPGQGLLDGIACPSAGLCVAVDGFDNAYLANKPVGGVWTGAIPIRPKSASQTSAIACTASFCAVVDSAGVETTGVIHS